MIKYSILKEKRNTPQIRGNPVFGSNILSPSPWPGSFFILPEVKDSHEGSDHISEVVLPVISVKEAAVHSSVAVDGRCWQWSKKTGKII